MPKADIEALIAIPVSLLIGLLLALAGSDGGSRFAAWPVFGICLLLAFAIQWLAFVPAYLAQSERYYDLTGSLSYLAIMGLALGLSGARDPVSLLLAGLVAIWALRLGSYLFLRIRASGKDDRFDALKPHPLRFLMAWSVQGLWISFTSAAALAAITTGDKSGPGLLTWIGTVVWLLGFASEAMADRQKSLFRKQASPGGFIHTGLWAWSRHPNYFGEILLWIGIAIIAWPRLQGWQYATLLSPVFVTILLTRISGIPLLEAKADAKWGGQPEYEAYKATTPVLIPRPPKR